MAMAPMPAPRMTVVGAIPRLSLTVNVAEWAWATSQVEARHNENEPSLSLVSYI